LLSRQLQGNGRIVADAENVLPVEDRMGVGRAMLALKPSHCRWPVGGVQDPDFHYCSAPRADLLRPYCAKHEQVAQSAWAAKHPSSLTSPPRWVS